MNQNISNLLQKRSVVAGLVGAVAFTAGATAGYILGKRNAVTIVPAEPENQQLTIPFNDNAVTVVMEDIFKPVHIPATESVVMFEQNLLAGNITEATHPELFETVPDELIGGEFQLPEPAVVNIFAIDDPDWDYEAELNTRSNEAPYILHKDEFFNDEMGFRQTTVTYYAGDDIMADEQDTPVYNHGQLMGPLKWGHGSGDPGIVYVRNEKSRQEWEIVLHTGRYEVEVLGNEYSKELAEDELRHSTNRRFRDV